MIPRPGRVPQNALYACLCGISLCRIHVVVTPYPDASSRGSRTDRDCSLWKIYVLGFAFFGRLLRQIQAGCQLVPGNAALTGSPSPDPRLHYHFLVAIGTSSSVSPREGRERARVADNRPAGVGSKIKIARWRISNFIHTCACFLWLIRAECSTLQSEFLGAVSTAHFLKTFLSTSPCCTTVLLRARWQCHKCLYRALGPS